MPLFYTRASDGLPRGWLKLHEAVDHSTVCPVFNTNRMVQEYTEACYMPVGRALRPAHRRQSQPAADLAQWRRPLAQGWRRSALKVVEADRQADADARRRASSKCRAASTSAACRPDDVEVQLFHGIVDNAGEIPQPEHRCR